jgi:ribosome maturation factor RimP
MTVDYIKQLVEDKLNETDIFLVDITVSSSNKIIMTIDKAKGVGIEECVEISRFINDKLDREIEDYELEVSSPGLLSPFKVIKQYIKNIGKEVEVLENNGIKHKGILLAVNEKNIELNEYKMIVVEGKKRKQPVIEKSNINFNQIKYSKVIITF